MNTGTQDYRIITNSAQGLTAAVRMLMKAELLHQFDLAKVLLYGEV